jgi:hypothetical protein
MNLYGLAISAIMIATIGIGHILVIKWEYYWGVKSWPGMLAIGIVLVVSSLFITNIILSTTLAMFGASLFWGVYELFKQRKRVEQGLFPRNPARKE